MDKQPTVAIDFDGVIANYDSWGGASQIGTPRADVIEALKMLRAEGWKIIVHSTRSAEEIREFLEMNSVPFDEINRNSSCETGGVKPKATVYWDDRAYRYSGDALADIEYIRNFRTWSGRK
jgi:hypothetical protein